MPLTIWNYVKSYKQSSNFQGKLGIYFPEITLTTEFPGSYVLLPTFSIGRKQNFQVVGLPFATVNFEPCIISRELTY